MGKRKHKRKFNDDEMSVILQAVENTAFLGKFSESVTRIKKQFRLKPPTTNDGEKQPEVADILKRIDARKGK